ncbi:MAG: dipeptidase [Maledivibacter sp.]|nr:dipeptidase [Maledivibacter sp.]
MNNSLKAKRIHENSIVVDSHLDLGGIIYNARSKGKTRVMETIFLRDFRRASFNFIIAAIFIENEYLPDMGLKMALRQVDAIYNDIKESNEHFVLVTNKSEMDTAMKENKIGIIMSLEGVEPIGRDLSLLNIFYKLGVRGLGLTWSRRNFAADGSYFRNPREGIKGGLTPFGIEVVSLAENLGMFIDVSHINDEGFSDVAEYTELPFIASHSNARSVNDITRNLTDSQIEIIGENSGVIGINAYKNIVSSKEEEQNVDRLCDHIEYIISLAGEDSIGFGFDLCNNYYNSGKEYDTIKNHSESLLITEELLRRGFSDDTLSKLVGGNYYRYLTSMLK